VAKSKAQRRQEAANAAAAALPFEEAWKAYCSTNPRLRNPQALPALVRRGVPDELRHAVWGHCLGVEASAAANLVAEALCMAAAAGEADARRRAVSSGSIGSAGSVVGGFGGTAGGRRSSPEVTPEESSREGTPREAPMQPEKVAAKEVELEEVSPADKEQGGGGSERAKSAESAKGARVEGGAAKGEEASGKAEARAEGCGATAPPEELREAPARAPSSLPSSSPSSAATTPRECGEVRPMPLAELIGGSGYLPRVIYEQIEADVLRTFPSNVAFREAGGPDQLRRVLNSLAALDPELGYCQSMNFLAATFIMVFGDEASAHLAVKQLLVKLGTRCWYTDGMRQLRGDTFVLEDLIKERLPNVHAALRRHGFDMLFVSSKWFLCLFSTTLQGETLKRVWDVMLCDGIEAVFRVALAMLALGADAIIRAATHDDLIFLFQDWQLDVTPEAIIAAAYDHRTVGPISRAELAQQRKQAAMRVSTADIRDSMYSNKFARGGVRPASMRAR